MTSGCRTSNWPSFVRFTVFVFGSWWVFERVRFVTSIRAAGRFLYSVLFSFSVHSCTWLKFQHRVSRTCPLFAAVKCFVIIVPWLSNMLHKVTKFVVTSPFWKILLFFTTRGLGFALVAARVGFMYWVIQETDSPPSIQYVWAG